MSDQRHANDLANRWTRLPLSSLAAKEANSFVDGPFGSDLKVSDYCDEGVRILQLQNLGDGFFIDDNKKFTTDHKAKSLVRCLVRSDDLLIAKMADPLARACTVPRYLQTALIVADVIKLRPTTGADPRFLVAAINSYEFRNEAERLSTGTTRSRISLSALKRIRLPNPSTPEQIKIGLIAEAIDSAIGNTVDLIAKYRQIKSGMIHDLFTRGLDGNSQLRPPCEKAAEFYKESPLGPIPTSWVIASLSKLAAPFKGSATIGPFGSDLVVSDYRDEGVPVIFVRDVKEDCLRWVSETYVSERKAWQLSAHWARPGDLIATKMGLPPCVACVYPDDLPQGIITADIIRFRPDTSQVRADWLAVALNHDRVLRQVQAITAGVTRPKVTLADFKKLRVALPKPDEQKRISLRIAGILDLIRRQDALLVKLRSQRLGLMKDLLTGEVLVKMDNIATEPMHV